MKPLKKIVVGVGNGFAFRFFISSGLIEGLQRNGYLVYLVGDPVFAETSKLVFLDKNSEIIREIDNRSKLKKFFEFLRANCLPRNVECTTISQFRRQELTKLRCDKRLLLSAIWFVFAYSSFSRWLFLRIEKLITNTHVLESQIRSVQADAVVVGGISGFRFDEIVGEASLRCGVPVISAILSWDNLSGLGYRFFDPSLVLVWSKIMRNDAIRIHRCNHDIVKIVGAIPFFKHFELIRNNGVDEIDVPVIAPTRTISFLTKSPKRFAFNLALFKKIRNEVINQGIEISWIIRIHPLTLRTNSDGDFIFKDEIEGFKKLALNDEDVELSLPEAHGVRVVFEDPDRDLSTFITILRRSDLVISMFSTAMLECALLNIPTLNICVRNSIFDASEATGSTVTSDRQELFSDFNQDHIKGILELDEIETCHSISELVDQIKSRALSGYSPSAYPRTKAGAGLVVSTPVDKAISEIAAFMG